MNNKYLRFASLLTCILFTQLLSAQCTSSVSYPQATTCQGSPYIFNGVQLDTAGTYNDTIVLNGGCDSIISLQLFVIPIVYNNLYDTICQGGSYSFGGVTLTAAGIYGDTLFYGTSFCDSVILLHLALRQSQNDTFRISATYCGGGGGPGGGYDFYGTRENMSGTYVHTAALPGGAVCADSVVILSLTVGGGNQGIPTNITACGATYNFYGQTLTANGNYSDTLTSSTGCDSIITIRLTLNSQYYQPAATNGTLCPGGSYLWRGVTYTQASQGGPGGGGYKDTVNSTGGCDTIYTLILRQGNAAPTVNIRDSFCAGSVYTYRTYTYSTSGRDTVYLPSTAGCDTTVILALTYKAAPTYVWVDSFCDGSSYTYRGHTYTDSGLHYFTVPAPVGCDSIIEVSLSYKSAPIINVVDSFCQGTSYTYRGTSYTTSGIHAITVAAPSGCDTVINLSLSYTTPPGRTIIDTICTGTSYIYGTDTFTTRGIHRFTVTTPGGCDSLITLDLATRTAPRIFVRDSFCRGTNYVYAGNSYDTTGIYTLIIPASVGCDTNVTLILTFKTAGATPVISASGNILTVNPQATSYQWYQNGAIINGAMAQSYLVTQAGVYYVITQTTGACEGISANDTVTNVGVNEVSGPEMFKLYPDPSNGVFTVEASQFSGTEINIYDVLGRMVYQKQMSATSEQIDMSKASGGTYYLVMKNEGSTRYTHFVIAK